MTPRTPYCGEISSSSQKFVLELRIIICLVWTDSSSEEGENNNVRNWSNNSFVYYMVVCETFIVLFAGYSCPNFPSFELSEFWKLQTLETKPSKKSQHFPIQTFAKPHIQTWVALIYFRTLRKWSAIFGLSFSVWCWLPRRATVTWRSQNIENDWN